MSVVKWNEARIERLQKEGRGQGELEQYRPWLEITDISSMGVSHRVFSPKTKRTHHLLSNIELKFFYMLEWCLDVVDIREQFPLSRTFTKEASTKLGVVHPTYPGTHVSTVMTVDFLVTRIRNGETVQEAFDIKSNAGVEDARTIEKLEITRSVLEDNGVQHHLVTESALPATKVANLAWISHATLMPGEHQAVPGFLEDCCARMHDDIAHASSFLLLNKYCEDFDTRFHYEPGTGLRVARILMNRRILVPDLSQPELHCAELRTYTVTGRANALRVVGGRR